MAKFSTLLPTRAVLMLSLIASTIAQPRPAGGQASGTIWQPGQPASQGGAAGAPWQPGQQQVAPQQQPWQPGQQQQQPPTQQQPPAQQQPWQPGQQQQQQPPPTQQQPWQPGQQQPIGNQQPPQQQPWQPGQQQPIGNQQSPQQQPVGNQQPGTQQPGTQQPGGQTSPVQTLPGTYNPNANLQNTALCPTNDFQTYSATDGSFFMIRCTFHHWTQTLEKTEADDFKQCIEKCAAKDGCKAVNYDAPNGKKCYLMGEGGMSDKAVTCGIHNYAFIVDPPTQAAANDMTIMCSTDCPYANHNTYNTIFGTAFRITCGRRHGTPHILSEGQASFKDCMDACAGINGCDSVDYHERSKTCYYSDHKGYPPMDAKGYSSAWNIGCAGACGGNNCGANLAPGKYPVIPQQLGPPKPDTSCGNIGMQHYASPNTDYNGNKNTNIDLFDPTVLKRRNPNAAGQTLDNPTLYRYGVNTKVGMSAAATNPIDIYGTKHDFGQYADNIAINHRGYIFAPQDGKYTFSLPSSDDITLIWVGQNAYSGYTRQNADIVQKFVSSGGTPVTTQIDLKKGTYTPIRIVWANRGGAGNFKIRITAPDNSVLLDEDSESNDYIVQYSCDNVSAPKFPEWGFEN
ncbi:hypothetical protein ABW20_dc0106004 [Dactylellina cionopaga]|nr:hypothetical protein ABW20_dc0106004 [Dactylellina cionopaga]